MKLIGKDAKPVKTLVPYGGVVYWIKKFSPAISKYEERHANLVNHKQRSHIGGRAFTVQHLYDNIEHYWDYRKKDRSKFYKTAVVPFFEDIHAGKIFTDDGLKSHPYYDYLQYRMIPEARGTQATHERCLFLMKSGIDLYNSIKNNGMYHPLDMFLARGRLNLYRGSRRLVIAKLLGYHNVPVRIFSDLNMLGKLLPSRDVIPDESINGLAVKQFLKWRYNATDKYWIHNYLIHYDEHVSRIRNTAKRVLEIGVFRGASLLLWEDVFPSAQIYGVDMDTSKADMVGGHEKIKLLEGRQEDTDFLKKKVVPVGEFDMIVDDGGHRSRQQKESFKILWDCVKKGGFYVIEDLYQNYVEKEKENNTMRMFKDMIDEMNLECEIKSMHFYYNICFVEKR